VTTGAIRCTIKTSQDTKKEKEKENALAKEIKKFYISLRESGFH